jgi:DNA-binding GntR family transcriptional regulator
MVLEPYAAGNAIERMTESDFEELAGIEQEMRDMTGQQDIERYVHLNQAFHMTLYGFSQQRRLITMIKSLWSGLSPLTPIAVPGQLERSVHEHHAMLQALQTKQRATVEELMRTHIHHAKMSLQAHLETMEP